MTVRVDCDHWYLVQTKPRQVARARTNLERQSFTVIVPERDETVKGRGRFVTERRPLFPNYLFVRIESGRSCYPIRNTFGVARLVAFGSAGPALVPRDVMRALISRFAEGAQEIELRAGIEARILQGPLAQLIARIEDASAADRVRILLDIVSGTVRTTIHAGALELL